MFVLRGVLALSLAVSLCAYNLPLYAGGKPLGILTLAYGAHLNASDAFAGLSVFDGESLSTDADGKVSARVGGSVITLIEQSAASLQRSGDGAHIDLEAGSVYIWSAESNPLEVHAEGALLRPHGGHHVQAQVLCSPPRFCRSPHGRAPLIFRMGGNSAFCLRGRPIGSTWNRRTARGLRRPQGVAPGRRVCPPERRWRISFWREWGRDFLRGGFTI